MSRTPKTEPDDAGPPWSAKGLAGLIAVTSAAASYAGLYGLGRVTGDSKVLAVSIPICVDAYTLLATTVWLSRRPSMADARTYARNSAFLGIILSMLGNGLERAIAVGMIRLVGWELFAVASIPTLALALVIHLIHSAFMAHKTPAVVDQLAEQQAAFEALTTAREVDFATELAAVEAKYADELSVQTLAFAAELAQQKLDFEERFAARETQFTAQITALQDAAASPKDEAPAEQPLPRQRRTRPEDKPKTTPPPANTPALRKASIAEQMTACYVAKGIDPTNPVPTQITRPEVQAACKAAGLRIGNDRITEVRDLVMKGTDPASNVLLQTSGDWDTADLEAINEAADRD